MSVQLLRPTRGASAITYVCIHVHIRQYTCTWLILYICSVSNFCTVNMHSMYLVVDCNWGTGDIGEPCSTVELTGLGYISCVGLCSEQGSGSTLHMFIKCIAFDASDTQQM